MRQHGRAFLERPLRRAAWNAILTVGERHTFRRQGEAVGCLSIEEVVRIREVLQAGEGADFRGNFAGKSIVRHIQLLEMDELGEGFRQGAGETIEAEVEHRQIDELADARIKAAGEIVVEQNKLIKVRAHATDACRHAAGNLSVR